MVVASLKSLRQRGQVMHAWIVSLLTFTIRFAIFRRQTNYLFSNELTHVSNHCMSNTKQTPRFLRPFPRLHLRYQTQKRGFHNHNETSTGKMRRITYEDLIKNLTGNACKERKRPRTKSKASAKRGEITRDGFWFFGDFSEFPTWVLGDLIWIERLSSSKKSMNQEFLWFFLFFFFTSIYVLKNMLEFFFFFKQKNMLELNQISIFYLDYFL